MGARRAGRDDRNVLIDRRRRNSAHAARGGCIGRLDSLNFISKAT
jgi:hypothetical protein